MYKFRTLKPDAEDRLGPYYGEELTRRTEEERTRIGGILRTTHLDEVPQLWNVLRGDMAIVGPRPIRPSFFAELCREIPQYWQRLVVRPGVTGFAQTRITREETWADKLAHDMEYIADRSVAPLPPAFCSRPWRRSSAAGPPAALAGSTRLPPMCGICGLVRRRTGQSPTRGGRADERTRSSTAAPTATGSSATGRSRWRRGGSRSSTSTAATSRSPTRTAASSSSRTARSTTTAS